MGKHTIRLYRRDFTPMLAAGVRVEALGYGWAAMGGPDEARLAAYGEPAALAGVAGWLRCPVEIYDAGAERVWWGYVASVEIAGDAGFDGVAVGLEHMANRVAVAYRGMDGAGGEAGWAEDTGSVGEYGRKELRLALGAPATAGAAGQARDAYLALTRYPLGRMKEEGGGTAQRPSALLACKGWWSTLEWEYYGQAAGREAAQESTGQIDLGGGTSPLRLAQPLRPAAGTPAWKAANIAIRARLAGQPSDGLLAQICADAGGAPGGTLPGAELAKGEVAGLAGSMAWAQAELAGNAEMRPDALLWLVLGRSGERDAANYYRVAVSQEMRYGRGACLGWDGSRWAQLAPECELAFVVAGSEETTAQAAAIAGSAQFITGVDIETGEGAGFGGAPAMTCQYRDGRRTRAAEILELLRLGLGGGAGDAGAGAGAGRLLAEVTADRRVRIYPEPGPEEAWRAAARGTLPGQIYGPHLEAIPADGIVAGRWLELAGAEAFADVGWIGGPSPAFVERCWIDLETGKRTLHARRPEQPAEDLIARLRTETA